MAGRWPLFSRLEAHVFRPAMATFTANDAVLPFPLRQALDRVDAQLDHLIYDDSRLLRPAENLTLSERKYLHQTASLDGTHDEGRANFYIKYFISNIMMREPAPRHRRRGIPYRRAR
jgi:hypothetical protein